MEKVVSACQLDDFRRRLVTQVSHGIRRRISLAEALLGDPSVLLLDEPTVGLDPLQIRLTRDLLSALAQSKTIILSSHVLGEVETLCQRVLILWQGRLVEDISLTSADSRGFLAEVLAPEAELRAWQVENWPQGNLSPLSEGWWRLEVTDAESGAREKLAEECIGRAWRLRELRSRSSRVEEALFRCSAPQHGVA